MAISHPVTIEHFRFSGSDDLEPRILELLEKRLARRNDGPYQPLDETQAIKRLTALVAASGATNANIKSVARMAGGASKEQFIFELQHPDGLTEKLVLRIDPLESIVETCRYREQEVLKALAGLVPLAVPRFLDGEGHHLGQPGMVTTFVPGVTKPPTSTRMSVSGVGTSFTTEWREKLAPEFIGNLARIHGFDWRSADLPHFSAPTAYPTQAALWQVNWWTKVWWDDIVNAYPILTLAERWMREHLPECAEPVLLHGDYRTGNFMFDAETGKTTAVLDWELTHIGDFHEDLGWMMQGLFAGAAENGEIYICNLMTREDLISRYEQATERQVNRRTLAFYELLNAYKAAAMNLGTGLGIAMRSNNHQDLLLSWLVAVGHTFMRDMAQIMKDEAQYDS